MASRHEDRVIALAGVVQAAQLVTTAARTGLIGQDNFDTMARSLFVFDPGSTLDVFGDVEHIRPGLKLTRALLAGVDLQEHGDLVRYGLSMMAVERSLAKRKPVAEHLARELREIAPNNDSQPGLGDNGLARIGELYQETISTIGPRIKIVGNRQHLQNDVNVNRIRTLLLAGIRSAWLWRQVGGRRRQLLLSRKPLKRAIGQIMNS